MEGQIAGEMRGLGVSRQGRVGLDAARAEGFSEGVAQPLVVGIQLANLVCGEFEPAQQ